MANLPVPALTAASPSDFDTGAWWNQNVFTPLTFMLNQPIFVAVQTITQSLASGAWTAINLDQEVTDTYGGHSTTANTSRFTAQVAGWYTVSGVTTWPNNATGTRGARIHVNGSPVQGAAQTVAAVTSGSFTGCMTPVRAVFLNVGDYVEVGGFQSSGGALSTGVASGGDLASALFVGWCHTQGSTPNLPVPALASASSNNLLSAALARTGIVNAGTFALNPALFVGTQTTSQSVSSGVWTTINLNTTQVDTYTGHSNTTNNSRYTAQIPGLYQVCGVAAWPSNATGVRGTRIHVNGAVVQGSAQMSLAPPINNAGLATPLRTVRLNVGDFVEVAGWQSSGAALSTNTGSDLASALFVCWAGS
jgi:hypothetical protein